MIILKTFIVLQAWIGWPVKNISGAMDFIEYFSTM